VRELSSAILKNYPIPGSGRALTSFQREVVSQDPLFKTPNLFLSISIIDYKETASSVTFTVSAMCNHNAYENTIPFEFGYYWYQENNPNTKHVVSIELNAFRSTYDMYVAVNNGQNWSMTRTFTVPKDPTYKKIILPFFKIGGVWYGQENPWPGWEIDGIGVLDVTEVKAGYQSEFTYAGQRLTAVARIVAGDDTSSDAYDNGIIISSQVEIPVHVKTENGYVQADAIYIYTDGTPKRIESITVYDENKQPHTMLC
jgi:hypothetical protein